MTHNRMDGATVFKDTLVHVFGLSEDTVSNFVSNLEQSSELELITQRIQTLPTEIFESLVDCIEFTSNDSSIDNTELGDEEGEQMAQFYADHVDNQSPEEHEEYQEIDLDGIKSVLDRLTHSCGCDGSSLREYMHNTLVELNQVDTETILDTDSDNNFDPAIKKRIDSLRASGNIEAAENLRKMEMRKALNKRRSKPRSPLDGAIDAKKRDLAAMIQKRNVLTQGQE